MTTLRHAHVDPRKADLKVGLYRVLYLKVGLYGVLALMAVMAVGAGVVEADLQVGLSAQPVRHAMGGMVLTVDVPRKSVVISHDACRA